MIDTSENGGIIFFDTETVGLYGQPVIIQYAQGDGPVIIHEFFRTQIVESLQLIEAICNNPSGVIGFNLTFDWFMLCKAYTTLTLLGDRVGFDQYPEDHIDLMGTLEDPARDGYCLKPVKSLDLMLHARKGPYQSMMNRGDIRIRRIPTVLAWQLAAELERRVKIKDIYFARKKDKKADKWKVYDIVDAETGIMEPNFKDVVLSFAPSSALKVLVVDALGIQPDAVLLFADIGVHDKFLPNEYGFAPFATANGQPGAWNGAWPEHVKHHISHWGFNELARKYATKDVEYLPALHRYFGSPPLGDDDSELACMVASVRWHGFRVDLEGLKKLKAEAQVKLAQTPTAPGVVKKYIEAVLDPTERKVLKGSTKKVILEELRDKPLWTTVPCPVCDADGMVTFGDKVPFSITPGSAPIDEDVQLTEEELEELEYANTELTDDSVIAVAQSAPRHKCEVCDGKKFFRHPASIRAEEVLTARMAGKEIELYDKLLLAGRFHASFNIIGTLSSRMAGTDKLNAQGIKKTKSVRRCFPLAFDGYQLCGGDFKSFEVVLADAVYGDPDLRRELQTKNVCTGCKGTKVDKGKPCADCEGTGICDQSIHAIFGTFVYPGYDYVGILNTKGTAMDLYTRSKSAVFAMLYGGEAYTLMTRLGVEIEVADAAYQRFTSRFKKVGEERRKVVEMFCSMKQSEGIGSKIEWNEPADYIESVFGFRRYFTLENMICKALFSLANDLPKPWREMKVKVLRRDRYQTLTGAISSALYGAIFGLQQSNMRAAANHVIQSAGAQVTKHLQRRIWDIQPSGISKFRVLPFNVHDELQIPTLPEYVPQLQQVVHDTVESFRPRVPLIGMDFGVGLQTWADK